MTTSDTSAPHKVPFLDMLVILFLVAFIALMADGLYGLAYRQSKLQSANQERKAVWESRIAGAKTADDAAILTFIARRARQDCGYQTHTIVDSKAQAEQEFITGETLCLQQLRGEILSTQPGTGARTLALLDQVSAQR